MRVFQIVLTLIFTVALACVPARPVRAGSLLATGLTQVIKVAAEEVVELAKQRRLAKLSVGQITPTGLPASNGGPAISLLLAKELERLQPGIVGEDAPLEVNGNFVFGPHPDATEARHGQKAIRLVFRVVDTESGEETPLKHNRFFVNDNTTIARVLQPTGSLPLHLSRDQSTQRRERNQAIQEGVKHPSAYTDPAYPTLISSLKE